MVPNLSLHQAYMRLQCKLVCLVLFMVLRQPSATGLEIAATGFLLLTPPALKGNLSSNNVLQTAERLHTGQISVPHSYVVIGDDVFAATSSGLIVNVAPCRPVVIANLRPRGCRTLQECGHPVSIRRSTENLLIVLDAYRGVFEVHPVTGVIRKLFDSGAFVNGRRCVYLNDLVIMKDGTIVVSDSSRRFDYAHEFWIRFEGRADGRLIGFSPVTGLSKEILSGLAYPTGLELSSNGQALLVSEASRARILRLDLRKDKFFQKSYVNINLPGMPEHIRRTDRGTYWVALSYPRFRGEPSALDQYSNKAASRNYMAVRSTSHELQRLFKKQGLAVELDEAGRIMRSIHDPSGLKVGEAVEVREFIGVLYVGTRSQQAAVRVVGPPNELTVDSLVQVLRGRCKVADDKIQATKESIEQQLQRASTQKPQENSANLPLVTPVPPYTHSSQLPKSETPQRIINLQSLSRGLSRLQKALLSVTVLNKKVSHTVKPPDAKYEQKEKFVPPTTEQITPIHQPPLVTDNRQIGPSPSTQPPVKEPYFPQNISAPQRIEGTLRVEFSHNSVSPRTVSAPPNAIHSFHFSNHAVLIQQPQGTSTGYSSESQQGVYRDKPQETSIGYSSGSQQGVYSSKPQDTSVGYSSVSQQDVPLKLPQETFAVNISQPQQGAQNQKPQETFAVNISQPQQGAQNQKPQETFAVYGSQPQQGAQNQKPQETFAVYGSQPQQGAQNQKPQETFAVNISQPQQSAQNQKPQETFAVYGSQPQQGAQNQKPQETFAVYGSQPQQGAQNQKPQETFAVYGSQPQQGAQNQKPQETFAVYGSQPQQDAQNQKLQETSVVYPSGPQQIVPGQKSQETLPPKPQDVFSQKPQETYALGPQQDSFNQKPQERYMGYSSGPQQGVFSQKPQETFIGYPSVPQQSESSYTETSYDPLHIPVKQPSANLIPVSSTGTPTFHQMESVTQTPPEVTTEVGGFMGFLGNSDSQNEATSSRYYSFQQDFGPLSDPGFYGQIEPAINTNNGASQRKHQFLPGMEPVVNFEQLPIPLDQIPNTDQTSPVNQSRVRASSSAAEMTVNSLKPRGHKRPNMNLQDISMKDAVEIQNMQMFHPTDRPELFIQQQNPAVGKISTTLQENAQPFANEMQQFHRTSLGQGGNEEYANIQGGPFQAQEPQAQQNQQHSQNINTIGHGRVGSSTAVGVDRSISNVAANTQVELVDPSTPLHQSFSNGSF
ncbi:hypothetical protein BsWGS_15700 [Bradybaena similaris]